MKIVYGTLFLTFVVLLNSIEFSSAQSSSGRGRGGPNEVRSQRPEQLIRAITVPNEPFGQRIGLPNGNVYYSSGTGPITLIYDPVFRITTVEQVGRSTVTIGPGPYPEYSAQNWPNAYRVIAQRFVPRPPGPARPLTPPGLPRPPRN